MPNAIVSNSNINIELVPVSALRPAPYNPRKWEPDAIKQLTQSIHEFGLVDPIIVNRAQGRENIVIGGHFRLKIAKDLGFNEVPVVYVDIPNETKERELNLRLNKNLGTWDMDILAEFDLDLLKDVGFDRIELDRIIKSGADTFDMDEEVKEITEPISKRGDIYKLGEHRLMCGDSTNWVDVEKLMDGQMADLISTDPPYCVGYRGNDRPGGINKDWSKTYHEVSIKDVSDFYNAILDNIIKGTKLNAAFYIWHADRQFHSLQSAWACHNLLLHQIIIWVKPRPHICYSVYPWQHESCAFGWKSGHKPNMSRAKSNDFSTVWNVDYDGLNNIAGNKHPTQKPIELFSRPMKMHTSEGDICYEPFSGSGTQIIAGEIYKRRVFGMEIEPIFVDVAIKRWEECTGRKVEKL